MGCFKISSGDRGTVDCLLHSTVKWQDWPSNRCGLSLWRMGGVRFTQHMRDHKSIDFVLLVGNIVMRMLLDMMREEGISAWTCTKNCIYRRMVDRRGWKGRWRGCSCCTSERRTRPPTSTSPVFVDLRVGRYSTQTSTCTQCWLLLRLGTRTRRTSVGASRMSFLSFPHKPSLPLSPPTTLDSR